MDDGVCYAREWKVQDKSHFKRKCFMALCNFLEKRGTGVNAEVTSKLFRLFIFGYL